MVNDTPTSLAHKRAFSEAEQAQTAQIIGSTPHEGAHNDNLRTYRAIAIDDASTKDRDDAINMHLTNDALTVDVFIADPTRFIEKNTPLDKGAANRGTTLYLREGSYPMLPKELSENLLSLNAGKATPAIRISTTIDRHTQKITSIDYEPCLVEADNVTYAEAAERIHKGDPHLSMWNQAALFLRSRRKNNDSVATLPYYDEESGVYVSEDGGMKYVRSDQVSAYNIVQESMILANHAAALLMKKQYGQGVFRAQKNSRGKALYSLEPDKHASLGLDAYTHATSPIRRYVDILVHRCLNGLGNHFTLRMDEHQPAQDTPIVPDAELAGLLLDINRQNQKISELYRQERASQGNAWLKQIFPNTDAEKLKTFDPVNFSIVLKAALLHGYSNDVFSAEVLRRLENRGGFYSTERKDNYGLIFPKDAVSILSLYANLESPDENWGRIHEKILQKLAADPQMLDVVFQEFARKVGIEYHIREASILVHNPKVKQSDYPMHAAFIAAEDAQAHTQYAPPEFSVGFSHRTAKSRAKLDYMDYHSKGKLLTNKEPAFPSNKQTYSSLSLYVHSAQQRIEELKAQGYTVSEKSRELTKTGANPMFKHEIVLYEGDRPVLKIAVRRESPERARLIALESALIELSDTPAEHTGLMTYTAQIANGSPKERLITQGDRLISPKATNITELEDIHAALDTGKYEIIRSGKREISIRVRKEYDPDREALLDKMIDAISVAYPQLNLVTRNDALSLRSIPQELRAYLIGYTESAPGVGL